MNILEELYYGNITPADKNFDPHSEYAALFKTIVDSEKELLDYLKTLPDAGEKQQLYLRMTDAQDELSSFSERNRFIEGFQLGARIMLDAIVLPQQSVLRDIR